MPSMRIPVPSGGDRGVRAGCFAMALPRSAEVIAPRQAGSQRASTAPAALPSPQPLSRWEGRACEASFEDVEERAVRAVVAVALTCQGFQRALHGLQLGDALAQLCRALQRPPLDLGAGAGAIRPQRQQPLDLLHPAAQQTRAV